MIMESIKEARSSKGKIMHYSVGAIIEKYGKYLLIDRAFAPFGFACVAGHVDSGERVEEALHREVLEEVGLEVLHSDLIFEGELEDNLCILGVDVHYWHVFTCKVKGKIHVNTNEAKGFGWYAPGEIKEMDLEYSWKVLLREIGIL